MNRLATRFSGILFLISPCAAGSLAAQEVLGRLVSQADSTPVLHALVLLLDAAGREHGRTAVTSSGGFDLRAPSAGRYHLRVQRIGQHGWDSPAVDLRAGETTRLALQVPDRPFELSELQVLAGRPHCGVTLGDASLGAAVLEAAQTALGLAEAEASEGHRDYEIESYRRIIPDLGAAQDSVTTSGDLAGWPIQSADPDSLRIKGFVQGTWPAPNVVSPGSVVGPTYFAPDARVLFTDWFLKTHCIALDTAADRTDPRTSLVAKFVPAKSTRPAAALTGQLVFDRATLSLRRLSFEFAARPSWAPRGSAGGELRFARLPDGAWVPASWQLRAPLPTVGTERYRFFGVLEVGGRVRSVRRPDGTPDPNAEAALGEAVR